MEASYLKANIFVLGTFVVTTTVKVTGYCG